MPTLAELRAQSGPKPLPRTTKLVTLVEGQHLLAEAEALAEEVKDLAREEARLKTQANRTDTEGERSGPPRKAGEGAATGRRLEEIERRQDAITARLDEISDDLGDHQGELGLEGMTGGNWQRFKDDNPAREDNRNDLIFASGLCDSTALFNALGKFVKTWDGEPVTASDWDEWLGERIAYADRRDLIGAIVKMHEQGAARSPKFRSASPTTSPSENG